MHDPDAKVFLNLDPKTQELPGYFEIIKCPMDMSTVSQKITRSIAQLQTPSAEKNVVGMPTSMYSKVADFSSDMRLIFNNCLHYNEAGSNISRVTTKIMAQFEMLFKHHVPCHTSEHMDAKSEIQGCGKRSRGDLAEESKLEGEHPSPDVPKLKTPKKCTGANTPQPKKQHDALQQELHQGRLQNGARQQADQLQRQQSQQPKPTLPQLQHQQQRRLGKAQIAHRQEEELQCQQRQQAQQSCARGGCRDLPQYLADLHNRVSSLKATPPSINDMPAALSKVLACIEHAVQQSRRDKAQINSLQAELKKSVVQMEKTVGGSMQSGHQSNFQHERAQVERIKQRQIRKRCAEQLFSQLQRLSSQDGHTNDSRYSHENLSKCAVRLEKQISTKAKNFEEYNR
jgi:hypothetical protein